MKNIFTEHPRSIGESYFQHMRFAFTFGFKMLAGGCACIIHGIFPFLFQKTGSDVLLKMMHDFVERMPEAEARVINLSECIDKKVSKE